MTTTAHGNRRHHGSTEEPTPTPNSRFNLRELQPWLYNPPPSSKLPKPKPVKKVSKPQPRPKPIAPLSSVPPPVKTSAKEKVILWLWENGPATTAQISTALGHRRSETVAALLRDEGIEGVGVVGYHLPDKGRPVRIWGIVEDGKSV